MKTLGNTDSSDTELSSIKNLQANHHIVSILEKAKENIELLQDHNQDCFFIFDKNGTILKCNISASSLLEMHHELAAGSNITNIFSKESKNIFDIHFKTVLSKKEDIGFEIYLSNNKKKDKSIYHFTIGPLKSKILHDIFYLNGKDITKIKDYEEKLSNIFSYIPIGIVLINEEGNIDPYYSIYTNHILDVEKENIRMKYYDFIFKKFEESLSKHEIEILKQIYKCIGEDEFWFNSIKSSFPKNLSRTKNQDQIVLYFNYHPILENGVVKKILIIIEDHTEINKEKVKRENQIKKSLGIVRRIQEIESSQKDILVTVFSDLEKLIDRANEAWINKNKRDFLAVLHGIKSISNTASLENLKDITNDFETFILHQRIPDFTKSESSEENFELIKKEIDDLKKIFKILSSDISKSETKVRRYHTSDLDDFFHQQIEKISSDLRKNVSFESHWMIKILSKDDYFDIKEILIHTINNAIDHGIEAPSERLANKKNHSGFIRVSLSEGENDYIFLTIEDDGCGLDKEQIISKSIRLGILKEEDKMFLSEKDIYLLLFEEGFSTKDTFSSVSGRGIGLDAVKRILEKKVNYSIAVESIKKSGTKFSFSFKMEKNL
jgi:PAS domain S-box-containing protein